MRFGKVHPDGFRRSKTCCFALKRETFRANLLALGAMRIKLSIPGQSKDLNLSQFTGNQDNVFAGCKFYVNEAVQRADAWFVIEDVDAFDNQCEVSPEQVHFLSAEASWRADKFIGSEVEIFLRQFGGVHSCHPVRLESQSFAPPFLPWMINANHGSIFAPHERDIDYFRGLRELNKERPLSVFCSAQGWTPEHRLRLAFVEHLKKELGDDLEWFGNGVNPVDEKWEGLATFERTLVLENRSDCGIYTEKALDAFLGLAVPIYWGAPNIQDYLPIPPSHQLNIADFRGATRQVRELLASPVSATERQLILEGKTRVLDELHFLRRIAQIARQPRLTTPASIITLNPRATYTAENRTELPAIGRLADFFYRRVYRPIKKKF